MTNHWVDIKNANVVMVMGGNAAEAHPVGFRWAMEAKNNNDATLIVVDPRFTRTASVADIYAPIRSGTDITFLSGVLRYLIENNKINAEYVKHYTNASLLVRDDFAFEDGLFSGYDAEKRQYDKSSWNYQFDENGYAKRDDTLTHPRCVWNLLKAHVSRYTPDVVENICGTPKADFLKVCEVLASTSAPDRTTTFLYALGWTQHTVGAQNIRTMAMIQLLLGNMGMAGGGVNALRGHSNIQGLTDLGLLSTSLPGYLTLPSEKQVDLQSYLEANTPKATLADQVNYWSNYPKFFVSLMKSFYGDAAQKENNWGYDWLPKWDQTYDVIKYFNMMDEGKVTGYFCQGFNPVASFPDKNKVVSCLSKLKYMVVIDPLVTETSTFWQNHGESNDVDPASIQTEVFRLPSTCFAEEDGSIANSGRWLQWHWKGQDAPGEARNDGEILAGIYHHLRELYQAEGGKGVEPLMKMSWNYKQPHEPQSDEVAKENNGYALEDLYDANGVLIAKKGQLLSSFAHLRDDGTFCQGFNPVASFPDKNKVVSCLSKLKYMVVIDPLVTETSTFWQNHGESNDVDPASIQTEVFRLPSTCFAEEDGSIANSGRWLQWHWKGQDAPGEARNDGEILAGIYHHLRELYQAEGGKGVEPLMKMSWNYKQPHEPQSDEVAKENNGYALEDLYDANGVLIAKKGQLLSSFAHLRDDGTTASSCWIYTGSWTEQGNQMANRDNSDPSGLGNTLGWAWAWPLNRRVLYNRASADINGKPWDPKRMLIQWNGSKWTGNDIPDFGNAAPGTPTGPFIMQPEGMGRLFAINKMAEGPFPEHYEPIETPLGTNPLHPNVVSNPVVRLYEQDALRMGKKEQFPYVGTTYRLTEHFHTWTKHALLNAIAQPEQFVEISETLAAAKGIANGDRVTVSSKRGFIRAVAVVTRRLKPLNVNGQQVETVGIPIHWGFEGVARKGYIANTLTPNVGDANSQTPEYKAFLVNIEKA